MELKDIEKEPKMIHNMIAAGNGCTITELVELSEMSRSRIRTALAYLSGAGLIGYRKIGMAKLYVKKIN